MIRRRHRWLAAAGVALAAAMVACTNTKTCSLVGCVDQAQLTVRRSDGAPAAFAVSVEADGHSGSCGAPSPDAHGIACGGSGGLRLTTRREGTSPIAQIIEISGSPKKLHVVLREGGAVFAERAFEPKYRTSQPNGPDCEPTCHEWTTVWDVP